MNENANRLLAAYMKGWLLHERYFKPNGGPVEGMDGFAWLSHAEYGLLDFSAEAEMYWKGFEDATLLTRTAKGQ